MLLWLHIMPWFADVALDRITPPDNVRVWRTDLLRQGRSKSTAAKSYPAARDLVNTRATPSRPAVIGRSDSSHSGCKRDVMILRSGDAYELRACRA